MRVEDLRLSTRQCTRERTLDIPAAMGCGETECHLWTLEEAPATDARTQGPVRHGASITCPHPGCWWSPWEAARARGTWVAPGTRQAVSFQSGLRAQGDCWRGAGLSLPQAMWTLWGILPLCPPLGSCCNPRPCYPAGDWGSWEVGGRGRRITFQAGFFFFFFP